jgi:hypothetical protein
MTLSTRTLAVVLAAGIAVAAAGCGGSSKPAYCNDLTNLKKSVDNISVTGGISSLKTQLQQAETDAKALVSSAKSDFPTETSAIQTSATSVQTAVTGITSSPTPAQLVSIAADAKSLVDAVTSFASSSKSKC